MREPRNRDNGASDVWALTTLILTFDLSALRSIGPLVNRYLLSIGIREVPGHINQGVHGSNPAATVKVATRRKLQFWIVYV